MPGSGESFLTAPNDRCGLSMKIAITHIPSPHIHHCQLTFIPRKEIDIEKARDQHRLYGRALEKRDYEVITLEQNVAHPDAAFVEDTALVLPEICVMLSMGSPERRSERAALAEVLADFREVEVITPPARIDGGDVLKIGKKIFVGESSRTDPGGFRALAEIVSRHGYTTIPVRVGNALHLKTACTALDDETVAINSEWVDPVLFRDYRQVKIPPGEPFAANVLKLGSNILVHKGFERMRDRLVIAGFSVFATDISEFLKAEAGITCLSILVE